MPSCRSGHSADIHNGKMYIFGGILELTKELNEMLCYNFETKSFDCSSKDSNADAGDNSGLGAADESPGQKRNTVKMEK